MTTPDNDPRPTLAPAFYYSEAVLQAHGLALHAWEARERQRRAIAETAARADAAASAEMAALRVSAARSQRQAASLRAENNRLRAEAATPRSPR